MTNYGWICPRCQKVHAPCVQGCNCGGALPDLIGQPLPSFPKPDPNGIWQQPFTCRTVAGG